MLAANVGVTDILLSYGNIAAATGPRVPRIRIARPLLSSISIVEIEFICAGVGFLIIIQTRFDTAGTVDVGLEEAEAQPAGVQGSLLAEGVAVILVGRQDVGFNVPFFLM